MKAQKVKVIVERQVNYNTTPTGDYEAEVSLTDMGELLIMLTKKLTDSEQSEGREIIITRFDRYTTQKIRRILRHTE